MEQGWEDIICHGKCNNGLRKFDLFCCLFDRCKSFLFFQEFVSILNPSKSVPIVRNHLQSVILRENVNNLLANVVTINN